MMVAVVLVMSDGGNCASHDGHGVSGGDGKDGDGGFGMVIEVFFMTVLRWW